MKERRILAWILSMAMLLSLLPATAWAVTEHQNIVHMEAVAGDCSEPGRREFWHCNDAGCGRYFADAGLSQEISLGDTFDPPPAPHSYGADGVCAVCGDLQKTMTFTCYDQETYSGSVDGMLFVLVAFWDGKAYVMGNKTMEDGSREAVEVPLRPDGAIAVDSATAEYFTFDFRRSTFNPDHGCMTVVDGKIVVYDRGRLDEEGLPGGIRFSRENSEDGSGCLWWNLPYGDDAYIVFDPETLTFRPSKTEGEGIFRYMQQRTHDTLSYIPAAEPTCTQQGTEEYWYCEDCGQYFRDHDFENPVQPGENEGWVSAQSFTIPALGHRYNADGVCAECGMKRPVYTQVSTLEEFDTLSPDASCLMVVKDGDKTYGAHLPVFVNPCDVDSDGDGIVDALEVDANGNAIPDCIEILFEDWCDCDLNGDGDIDDADYRFFVTDYTGLDVVDMEAYALFLEYNYWDITLIYLNEAYDVPNYVEVTMAPDGSITLAEEGAMEFRLMAGGVWGGTSYAEEDFAKYSVLDTERVRAAWVPNYWVAVDGMLGYQNEGHFTAQYRTYGDGQTPGIADYNNWKISFGTDGQVIMSGSWTDQKKAGSLQFVKYLDAQGNEAMTFVDLPQELWADSEIMQNRTETLAVYLYAAEPSYAGVHQWDEGVETKTPTCTEAGEMTYTCADCGAVKTAHLAALGHDWSSWAWENENSHMRRCKRDCGAAECEEHTWSNWVQEADGTHTRSCRCDRSESRDCQWDAGVVTREPTTEAEGERTYTCAVCGGTRVESIPRRKPVIYDLPQDGSVIIEKNDFFADGTLVKVQKVEEGEIFEAVAQSMKTVAEAFRVFTFSAVCQDIPVEPAGKLRVTLRIPDGYSEQVALFYLDGQGELVVLEALVDPENRTITLELDRMGTYILADMDTAPTILLGDVNNDGKVNARDARALLRYIAGLVEAGEILEAAADFNGDGKINARDARAILRSIAGLE